MVAAQVEEVKAGVLVEVNVPERGEFVALHLEAVQHGQALQDSHLYAFYLVVAHVSVRGVVRHFVYRYWCKLQNSIIYNYIIPACYQRSCG